MGVSLTLRENELGDVPGADGLGTPPRDRGTQEQEADGAFGGVGKQGAAVADSVLECHRDRHDRRNRANAYLVDARGALAEGTGQRQDWRPGALCPARDLRRDFTARGLEIDCALGGNYQVSLLNELIQVLRRRQLFQEDLEPVAGLRAHGHQPGAQATGGA